MFNGFWTVNWYELPALNCFGCKRFEMAQFSTSCVLLTVLTSFQWLYCTLLQCCSVAEQIISLLEF